MRRRNLKPRDRASLLMRMCAVSGVVPLLLACSIRPVPDDVSPLPTEDIVRSMRCETKHAVRDRIAIELERVGAQGIEAEHVLDKDNLAAIKAHDPKLAAKLLAYGASSIAYRFEFQITETNDVSGTLGFKVPFSASSFALDTNATFNRTRDGLRRFETVETFAALAKLDCRTTETRTRNYLYPITGSIGMKKAVHSFIELTEFGGAKGEFTDTLTFTTSINTSIKPSLTLAPVTDKFRVVNASGDLTNGRVDKHMVTVSFAFPTVDLRDVVVDRIHFDRRLSAPSVLFDPASLDRLTSESIERAKENLCVARGLDREAAAGQLRLYPPELYCKKEFSARAALAVANPAAQ